MNKKLSICFLLVAMFTILVHASVPHHEHLDKICFEKTHCDTEQDANHSHGHTIGCCFENYDLIRPQNENLFGCEHGSCCDFHFPPLLLFVGNFFELEQHSPVAILPDRYINLYTSIDLVSSFSLRGPPQAIV